jgi:hypothetical protein
VKKRGEGHDEYSENAFGPKKRDLYRWALPNRFQDD